MKCKFLFSGFTILSEGGVMGYQRETLGLGLDLALSKRQKTLILGTFFVLLLLLILAVFYGPPLIWMVFAFLIIILWVSVLCYVSSRRGDRGVS